MFQAKPVPSKQHPQQLEGQDTSRALGLVMQRHRGQEEGHGGCCSSPVLLLLGLPWHCPGSVGRWDVGLSLPPSCGAASPALPLQSRPFPPHPSPFLRGETPTGADPTWFLRSSRDPSHQTWFQLEGSTTHTREPLPVSALL